MSAREWAPHMAMVSSSSALSFSTYTFTPSAPAPVDHVDEGPADQHTVRTQGQRLEYVHAAADAAVHQDDHLIPHRVGNGGKDFGRGGDTVQHPAPWLDTTMPAAPASRALRAPFTVITPLIRKGTSAYSRSPAAPPPSCARGG